MHPKSNSFPLCHAKKGSNEAQMCAMLELTGRTSAKTFSLLNKIFLHIEFQMCKISAYKMFVIKKPKKHQKYYPLTFSNPF
jgi:hypothetical protein